MKSQISFPKLFPGPSCRLYYSGNKCQFNPVDSLTTHISILDVQLEMLSQFTQSFNFLSFNDDGALDQSLF